MPRIVETRVYVGRNLLCDFAAVAARLRFDAPAHGDSRAIRARLTELLISERILPELGDLPGTDGEDRLARLVGWLAAELQNAANAGVDRYGAVRDAGGDLWALAGFQSGKMARAAIAVASRLVDMAAKWAPDGLGSLTLSAPARRAVANVVSLGRANHLGLHSQAIARAAVQRNIPVYGGPAGMPWAQLGQGANQKLISATTTNTGGQIAAMICDDKEMTAHFLRRAGLPTTSPETAMTFAAAEGIARRIGYPVAVKPASGTEGDGVTADVRDPAELKRAFARVADLNHGRALVERHVAGDEIRLLTVDGRLISAVMRVPAHVVGDGGRTILELVAEANRDPRRGPRHQRIMSEIVMDERAALLLHRQGYGPNATPKPGERVFLSQTSNIATGATAIEVTNSLHPDVRLMAEAISRALRLDIAGIDYITGDLTGTWRNGGGYVCEVNHRPSLAPHLLTPGDPRRFLDPIIDRMFGRTETGRIPTAFITGGEDGGARRVAEAIAERLAAAGKIVGVADAAGIRVAGVPVAAREWTPVPPARLLVCQPAVEVALAILSTGELVGQGVPLDACDVAAILPGSGAATAALVAASATGAIVAVAGRTIDAAAVPVIAVDAGAGFEERFVENVVGELMRAKNWLPDGRRRSNLNTAPSTIPFPSG